MFQILVESVNFFNYRTASCLESACSHHPLKTEPYPCAYPPRFIVTVSAEYARQPSVMELKFTGAKHDFHTNIQLYPVTKGELVVTKIML